MAARTSASVRSFAHLRAVAWLACAVPAVSCARESASIRIEKAVLVLPSGGAPAAVYFTVRNDGDTPAQLTGLDVDAAEATTIQTTTAHRIVDGGTLPAAMEAMSDVKFVTIGAGSEVRFAPGGYTGVIPQLRRPLQRGDTVRLKLHVTARRTASVVAHVVVYADLDSALGIGPGDESRVASQPSRDDGREVYMSNGCATCHGMNGHGDGPVGRTLSPPPRDFRDASAYRNGADAASIAQTIATGLPNGGSMPRFAHLSNSERQSLALYLISIRTSSPAASHGDDHSSPHTQDTTP